MENQITKTWNKLNNSEKLEIIEKSIDMCNTNEGFLMLRLWRNGDEITAHISTKLDNHLCTEAVSQDTLISLFGQNYDFEEQDADTILTWMNKQI